MEMREVKPDVLDRNQADPDSAPPAPAPAPLPKYVPPLLSPRHTAYPSHAGSGERGRKSCKLTLTFQLYAPLPTRIRPLWPPSLHAPLRCPLWTSTTRRHAPILAARWSRYADAAVPWCRRTCHAYGLVAHSAYWTKWWLCVAVPSRSCASSKCASGCAYGPSFRRC